MDISRQTKGYKKLDPPTKQQKALPVSVYRFILRHARSPKMKAKAHLLAGALFFAMRSCEYSKAGNRDDDRRTITVRLKDVKFHRRRSLIPHSSRFLHTADSVSITFLLQKRDNEIGETVTMHRTRDAELNPVLHWAYTIRRVRRIEGWTNDSPVDTIAFEDGIHIRITSSEIRNMIRAAVSAIGKDVLGFSANEIGTHSNRSAAAMAMYLANVPVYTIMLIGRWSSDAFLLYIRKQVQEFTIGISNKMLITQDFYTIPDEQASGEDPRTRGNTNNFATNFFGASYCRNVVRASFALHH